MSKRTKNLNMDAHSTEKKCEPCTYFEKNVVATCICCQCKEYMCCDCRSHHLSQKQSKNHQIKSFEEKLMCGPCHTNGKTDVATSFCQDCADPEALCTSCAAYHKASKKTKEHRMSSDMDTYIIRYHRDDDHTRDVTSSDGDVSQPLYEPCGRKNETKQATNVCKICSIALCQGCIERHESLNNCQTDGSKDTQESLKRKRDNESAKTDIKQDEEDNKKSKISGDTAIAIKQSKRHSGLPCKCCRDEDKTEIATVYCTDCEIPLCTECADIHKTNKKTKHHTISKDVTSCILMSEKRRNDGEHSKARAVIPMEIESNSSTITSSEGVSIDKSSDLCDPCFYQKKEVKGSYFCADCNERFCEDCMNFHRVEKDNVNHKVTSISRVIIYCVTCRLLKKDVEASVCCLDCNDPKPLCSPCAQRHTAMKTTRGHNMSSDLDHLRLSCNQMASPPEWLEVVKMGPDSRPSIQTTQPVKPTRISRPPYATECRSNRISLQWLMTGTLLDHETFQIMFKESPESQSAIWKSYNTESCFQPHIEILGLTPKTSYIFKVRIFNKRTGEEFPFTDESELIRTQESPAKHVLKKARKTKAGSPAVYTLPIKENRSARNVRAKTRKFYLGTESVGVAEKTLMIVGATGSGKSTLINAIANYIIGVEWEDDFRFNLIDLEPEEKKRSRNEAQSLTQWVTCYTLHSSVSDRINYTVNLIDTPGFGDTRGLDHDAKIVDQIRELFTAKDQKGISTLDAVCFIVKAPDARLTPTQTYIFESILCLFGNDIKDNICTLITFADGQTPPVLAGIKALDGIPLPCDTYFTFNNSALYAENSEGANNQMSSFFWQMGMKSYQTFFSHVTNMQTRSLWLTTEVLEKRQKLENTIYHLHQEIDVGLSKINLLEGEVKLFSDHSREILANKNFEYTVEEDYQEKLDLQGTGQHTTNCLTCNFTCHENCRIPNDDKKAGCIAMNSEGSCMECPNGCHWSEHHNTPYIIKWFKRKVTKRYEDMKRKYEEATQKTLTQEQVLDEMNQDITKQEQGIQVMLVIISKLTNRLKEIALRPDPFSTVEYIDLMIASEEMEKKSGFEARINALKKCRQRAQYGDSVQIFRERIQNTRQSIAASDIAEEVLESDMSIIGRIKRFFRQQ